MGESPEPFVDLLRQISAAEGEKYDAAYRSWEEGINLSFRKNRGVSEPVLETPQLPARASLPLPEEPAHSRIIGENDRRRVLHQEMLTSRSDPDSDAEQRRFEDYEFASLLRST